MTLTPRQIVAVKWLIRWTKECVQERMDAFEDMERTGEIEKGHLAYVQSIIDELKKIEEA